MPLSCTWQQADAHRGLVGFSGPSWNLPGPLISGRYHRNWTWDHAQNLLSTLKMQPCSVYMPALLAHDVPPNLHTGAGRPALTCCNTSCFFPRRQPWSCDPRQCVQYPGRSGQQCSSRQLGRTRCSHHRPRSRSSGAISRSRGGRRSRTGRRQLGHPWCGRASSRGRRRGGSSRRFWHAGWWPECFWCWRRPGQLWRWR